MRRQERQLYFAACFTGILRGRCSAIWPIFAGHDRQPRQRDILLTHTLLSTGRALWSATTQTLAPHAKWMSGVVAALVLGTGGGALALVNLGPDVEQMPIQQVLETVQPLAALPDAELAAQTLTLYRSDITRNTDTADTLLTRLGVFDPLAAQFLRKDALAQQYVFGRSGRSIAVQIQDVRLFDKLTARWTSDDTGQFKRLVIERTPEGFSSRLETAALEASTRLASGTITSSLYAATDEVGLPDSIANQLAEIFSGDIDFRRSLRKGDRFNVVYEILQGDGEPLRAGRVLSAEFVNAGKIFQAMWFQPPADAPSSVNQRGGYYTLDGQSLRRAFLSSPVQFSRVSSGFAMRFHPVLKSWRRHLGTDFAAPTGTPARTVGDGIVTFAGVQNGYGNVIFIKHRNNTETVYAHLSKILVKRGQNVGQGETIGLVGSTGWATGPHLHFEVRVGGVQYDPMKMARQSETVPVPAAALPVFRQLAANVQSELQAAASVQTSRFE